MQKNTLFALVFSAFALQSFAQCTFPLVTGSYTQISTNTTINATGGIYWICAGRTVTIASSQGDVYVCENNVTLNITGSAGDAVYAKPGCVINNNSSADIGVTGNPGNIVLNNNGSGTTTLIQTCNPLVYDYTLVVGGPGNCITQSGISELNTIDVVLFPNPFSNYILLNDIKSTGTISIVNVIGEQIVQQKIVPGNNKIDTQKFTPGIYFLRVETEEGVTTKKIIKH